jgi:hypothetical protein
MLVGYINSAGIVTEGPVSHFTGIRVGSLITFKVLDGRNVTEGDSKMLDFRPKRGNQLSWPVMADYIQDAIRQSLAVLKKKAPIGQTDSRIVQFGEPGPILFLHSCPCGRRECNGAYNFNGTPVCRFN